MPSMTETFLESQDRSFQSRPDAQAGNSVCGEVLFVGAAHATLRLFPGQTAGSLGAIGSILKIASPAGWVLARIRTISRQGDETRLEVDFLGEAKETGPGREGPNLSRGLSSYPVPGSSVSILSDAEVVEIFDRPDSAALRCGTVHPYTVPAYVDVDNLLSKHFAVLGSTGTGKSSAVALTIHRLVETLPDGHILILDPHNEYASAFSDIGVHFDPTSLSLPYWLMNLEEHIEVFIGPRVALREVEVDILKRSLLAARKKSSGPQAGRVTVDTPVPYKLSDLLSELDTQMGRLEKPEKHLPFLRLKHKIEELRADERYGFMFSGMLIHDSFAEIVSRMLRMPTDGKPVSTLDLSGVPSDIVDVVVSLLCRMVFDFAMWSRKGEGARPLLLVCEEAHRYVPREKTPRFDSARRVLERIAKEGRKYGVSLGLVSQRPSDVSESVLSQCGTILAMRMNNERDARFVASALPEGSDAFMDSISALANRECVICGEGVAIPMRVKLDFLEEGLRPSSADPAFVKTWRSGGQSPAFVKSVIDRWRAGER